MTDIPRDIESKADDVWYEALSVWQKYEDLPDPVPFIALAILAERERSKAHWLQWHRKRAAISQGFWLRAAKAALAGDVRELRNRVDLCEAEPVELVLSEADTIRSPERAGE